DGAIVPPPQTGNENRQQQQYDENDLPPRAFGLVARGWWRGEVGGSGSAHGWEESTHDGMGTIDRQTPFLRISQRLSAAFIAV
ncbi:MAG: hypothetical protein ACI9MB_005365, partial [Verrucomicrobiales bacterium]